MLLELLDVRKKQLTDDRWQMTDAKLDDWNYQSQLSTSCLKRLNEQLPQLNAHCSIDSK
jgi:hypothetical protein